MDLQKYEKRLTPVEAERRRRRRRRFAITGLLVLVLALLTFFRFGRRGPATYADIEEHFKYGSIGSDIENGLPLRVMQVLPQMFPEYLPEGSPHDYTAFGFVQEAGQEMPIGFSRRRGLVETVGLNCAACHTGVVRASEDGPAEVYLGMPSNTTDLQAFFEFLFDAAADPRFTPERVMAEMDKREDLSSIDRLIYRRAVPAMKAGLLDRKAQLDAFMVPDHPKFGPGRVDTFNPYKTNQFALHYAGRELPYEERFGTADFPSVWNQRPREGMNLHWDGNNTSVRERNLSAAFGAGATPENVALERIDRIRAWLNDLEAPAYPFTVDEEQAARGRALYRTYCYDCHDFEGAQVGQVVPLEEIGTDPHRLHSYTEELSELQRSYGDGYEWDFEHFRKTHGYANVPLDGLWARAPYLHNGSVPTLWDLLTPAAQRNEGRGHFYRGHGVYDSVRVGFRTDIAEIDARPAFRYVLSETGNSNRGHSGARYGTELSEEDKWALIEYMKTL